MRIWTIAAVALLLSAPLYAQDETARKHATEVMARVPFEKAVKGAPYSAETIVESSQSLADGNHIARKTTGRIFRDGEGRTRREEDRQDGSVGISITDPVAGVAYSLDPGTKTAWKTGMGMAGAIMGKIEASRVEAKRELELDLRKLQAENEQKREAIARERVGPGNAHVTGPRENAVAVTTEAGAVMMHGEAYTMSDAPLEHKTIEGIAVEGRKTTATIPAGKVGNEQPIAITSEEWSSPDLQILVLTKHADPRMGESSYRLVNIIRAEPDRSLFMVPADYSVKETGIKRMLESSRRQQ
jgi:hypothetical protein